jgi:hypothetical protein
VFIELAKSALDCKIFVSNRLLMMNAKRTRRCANFIDFIELAKSALDYKLFVLNRLLMHANGVSIKTDL